MRNEEVDSQMHGLLLSMNLQHQRNTLAKKKNDTLHPETEPPPKRVKFTTETPLNYPPG